ncbi:MAG TPA: 6-carboxytetrahydropterin synthase [Gemmatimonadales bacterium]|jgi:6-pyruvoyltetrahydropterin/6-carboxytetrahydropterin synthase|nr:6-carboxytetrahydropterin synthase [Gemmatimonadales bacterium]
MHDSGRGFKVSVRKEDLVFAAAHFITLPGHRCESLHGHNYRAGVELTGTLEPEAWYVFDFVALKQVMRRLTNELDHKVLLPTTNPTVTVQTNGESVAVRYDGRSRYVFPASDCVLLPIPNTTVEMLAEYLAGRLKAELKAKGAAQVASLEIEVEENFGQSASYREALSWD